jgi:hypothetical protein
MKNHSHTYLSYLLRLYPIQDGDTVVWRASLENPLTGERLGFPNLTALMEFLESCAEVPPSNSFDHKRNTANP